MTQLEPSPVPCKKQHQNSFQFIHLGLKILKNRLAFMTSSSVSFQSASSQDSPTTSMWVEQQASWDMKTGRYTKHIQYEDIKLVVVFNRIYEDVLIVEQIQTLDGQNIIDLVRDRAITVIERMLAKDFK